MIKIKKNVNNIFKLFILIIITNFSFVLSAKEIKCKKFDISCKSSKLINKATIGTGAFIKDTIEYQKKGLKDGKKQIKGSSDKIMEVIPKKK